jgi:DNA-binding beta-propeller fold protein YncE
MRYVVFFLYLSLCVLAEQRYLSPSDIAVSEDGSVLYIACAADDSIQVFDVGKEKVSSRIEAKGVRQIALSSDNARLYAVCGEFAGKLLDIDAKTGRLLRSFSAGHTPMDPVITPDGKTPFFQIRPAGCPCVRYRIVEN